MVNGKMKKIDSAAVVDAMQKVSKMEVAQRISGLEVPNLVVYGGGTEIQEFCQKKGILYLSDFINAKKI